MRLLKFLIVFLLLSSPFLGFQSFSQKHSVVTKSKKCGKCGQSVSKNSTVGMRCPHCGVRWGSENTTNTQSQLPTYDINDMYNSNYWSSPSSGYSNTKCICGRSKSSSEFLCYTCRTTCICGRTKGVDEVLCYKCRTTCICGRTKGADEVLCYKCKTTCSCGNYKKASDVFCSKCKAYYHTMY